MIDSEGSVGLRIYARRLYQQTMGMNRPAPYIRSDPASLMNET